METLIHRGNRNLEKIEAKWFTITKMKDKKLAIPNKINHKKIGKKANRTHTPIRNRAHFNGTLLNYQWQIQSKTIATGISGILFFFFPNSNTFHCCIITQLQFYYTQSYYFYQYH